MKFTYFRLGLIVLLSTVLLACGASSSKKFADEKPDSNNSSNGNTTQHPDLGDGFDDGLGDDTTTEGDDIIVDNELPDDSGTILPNSCPLPADTEYNPDLLDRTSDSSFYDISSFDPDESGDDLTGTWAVTVNSSAADLYNASLYKQRYIFVVRKNPDNQKLEAANCSGLLVKEELSEKVCTIHSEIAGVLESHIVPCGTPGSQRKPDLVVKKDYLPWHSFLPITVKSDSSVTLPLYLPSMSQPADGVLLSITDDYYSRMSSPSGAYQAIKISSLTSPLGKSSINIRETDPTIDSDTWCSIQVKAVNNNCLTTTPSLSAAYVFLGITDQDQLRLAIRVDESKNYFLYQNYVVAGDTLNDPKQPDGSPTIGPFSRSGIFDITEQSGGAGAAFTDTSMTVDMQFTTATSPVENSSVEVNLQVDR